MILNTANEKHPNTKRASFLLSLLAAISLAMIAVLANWDFELRSGQKLALQVGVLTLVLWLVLYVLVFRRVSTRVPLRLDFFIYFGLLSAMLCVLLIPWQGPPTRFAAAFGLTWLSILGIVVSFSPLFASQNKGILLYWIFLIAAVGGLIGIVLWIFNSFSVRMYGDDFCYTYERETRGFLGSVMWFYTHWSGRFFSNFLLMGLGGWRWTTLVQLIAIPAATFVGLLVFVKGAVRLRIAAALAGAFWIPFTVFSVIPDVYKSLYWIVSSVVVLPLMILIPLFVWSLVVLMRSSRRWLGWGAAAVFGLSFMIATTHEAAVLGWLIALGAAIGLMRLSGKQNTRLLVLLSVGVGAAVVGLAVSMFAPGNAVRAVAQGYTRTLAPFDLVAKTGGYFFAFLRTITPPGWLALLGTLGLGWALDSGLNRSARIAALVPVIVLAAAASCFIPGVYAMSSVIPPRTQLIPGLYLVYGMWVLGMLLPKPNRPLFTAAICILLLILLSVAGLQNSRRILPTLEPMRQFARDWDARDRLARQANIELYRIPIPWDAWEQEFECTIRYYEYHFNQDNGGTGAKD